MRPCHVAPWKIVLAGVLLFAAFLAAATTAHARSCRVTLLPNGIVSNCGTCHTSPNGGGARNAFGRAVQTIIENSSNCNRTFWGPDLAKVDSDGDGLTNGDELQDPEGTWTPGMPNPGSRALVTNPGVSNPKRFVRGDFNGDGSVNITDAVGTLSMLFAAGPQPPCKSAADSNNDGKLDVTDAIHTLEYLFSKGPAPPGPFPRCGTAPAKLGCLASGKCA
jgi:hypothetical protein